METLVRDIAANYLNGGKGGRETQVIVALKGGDGLGIGGMILNSATVGVYTF